jgi:hypothetical protein
MSAWGTKPDEADKAQEWLFALWEESSVKEKVENALIRNVEAHHEEVRVAAFSLYKLRDLMIWEREEYIHLAAKAVLQLQAIAQMEIYSDDDFQLGKRPKILPLSMRR